MIRDKKTEQHPKYRMYHSVFYVDLISRKVLMLKAKPHHKQNFLDQFVQHLSQS